MNFCSDNVTGIAPEILAAIVAANEGAMASYGEDPITARLETRLGELFERDVSVVPVATGTAANALALACMTPPFGAVYCHVMAHIASDECGAPEFYTGGAKLVTLPGDNGKLAACALEDALRRTPIGSQHAVQPAAVSVAQVSEAGTVYLPQELSALAEVAHRYGLPLHLDGARLAGAVAALGISPAQATWRAGVDVLSFGATKNGAMAAEAVIFFDPSHAREVLYRRKRAGHLVSKQRFVCAQLEAYLHDDLWLRNARHANAMAARLASGLQGAPGVTLRYPVDANMLFVEFPEQTIRRLLEAGFLFHRIGGQASTLVRLVTAFETHAGDIDRFIDVVRS